MSEVLHSSDATFVADVLNSDVPVLLDFLGAMVRTMQNDCANP